MVKINLIDGYFALVDDNDYELIKKYKWYLRKAQCGLKYAYTNINGKNKSLHRIILNEPDSYIDHKNRNGLDNRRENLRLCTPSQNMGNTKKYKTNTSGYKGVYKVNIRSNGKIYNYWVSSIHGLKKDGKYEKYHQKTFKIKEEAVADYEKAAKKYFGDFARC